LANQDNQGAVQMNRDDIIRKFLDLHPDTPLNWGAQYAIHLRAIKRMLEVTAATEREACAKLVDEEMADYRYGTPPNIALNNAAAAIRARGEK